jgi:cytochrome c553
MKRFVILTLALAIVSAAGILAAQQQANRASGPVPPPWAYGFIGPAGTPAPPAPPEAELDPRKVYTLPGSKGAFTAAQISDGNGPADWYPELHGQMPDIVARGSRERMVNACGLCHYPNGKGRPSNASVSGLPYSYFVQQMMDFRDGKRKSADTRKVNTNRMQAFAKAMTDEEIKAAAAYYSAIPWTPWIRVVESDTVPKTDVVGGVFLTAEGARAGREPIGQRIIETPEDTFQTEVLRNPKSGLIAYVPPGSVKKGEALATTGAGRTTQCAACHGPTLEGLGPVPGIAGRSPSYTMRQLFDMQQGTRNGLWTDLMKPVVAKLTAEDMLNLAAYTASLKPGAAAQQSRAAR